MQFIALTKNPQWPVCNGQGGIVKMRCHVFLDLTYIYGTISLHVLSTAKESLLIIMPLYPQVFGVKR